MNKYQQALIRITDWFHSYKNDEGITIHERHITPAYKEAENILKELVGKATPKQVKRIRKEGITDICPTCKSDIPEIIDPFGDHWLCKYCHNCGQKLSWITINPNARSENKSER